MKAVTPKIKLLIFLALLVSMVLTLFTAVETKSDVQSRALINSPLPEFELMSLDGNNAIIRKDDLHRYPYQMINVWASWCGTCKLEHGYLNQLAANGVPIFGINYRDTRSNALSVLAQQGNPYIKNVFDPKGILSLDLGVIGTPEHYLVDQDGVIVARYTGELTPDKWVRYFAEYFEG